MVKLLKKNVSLEDFHKELKKYENLGEKFQELISKIKLILMRRIHEERMH